MKTLILGLGKTGFSVIKALNGKNCIGFDTRENFPLKTEIAAMFPSLPLLAGTLPSSLWDEVDRVMVSPSLNPRSDWMRAARAEADRRNIHWTHEIQFFLEQLPRNARVIGITGSNGKSTVSALTFELLKALGFSAKLGGNFGTPALDLREDGVEVYVLELSSFQLEYCLEPLNLFSAVVLNLSPNHLDRHQTFSEYGRVKSQIYQGARHAIRPHAEGFFVDGNERFSAKVDQQIKGKKWLMWNDIPLMDADSMKLQGDHQFQNVLAALALVYPLIPDSFESQIPKMLKAIQAFSGLPHRCALVRQVQGVDWVNDAKSTSGASTLAAIQSLGERVLARGGKIILLCGGQAKGARFERLRDAVSTYVKSMYVFGQDACIFEEDLNGFTQIVRVETLNQAMVLAGESAKAGDLVLLSPACASLDQFRNFEERGHQFETWVQSLF